MPKLLYARDPEDVGEENKIRKLAGSRHAPGDWIIRARIVCLSWQGLRTAKIAEQLGCHPKTVRKRLHRFNALGIDGLWRIVLVPDAIHASPSWSAPRSSLFPEWSRPGAWCVAVVENSKPSMRRGRHTGRWMHLRKPLGSAV